MSCGARKVNIEKLEVKKDSIATTEVKAIVDIKKETIDSTNIKTDTTQDEITVQPIDTCKEMVVEGKHYKNVVLKIKKIKTNSLYTNKKKESETKHIDSTATSKVIKKEVVDSKLKTIDKKANYCWIIWLLLLILILYLLWRNKRRLFLGL
jgi:predicted RND superfamily exporter protein